MNDRLSLSGQMFDSYEVWDHLEAAAAAGYSAVELRSTHAHPNSDPEYLNQIKAYCEKHRLKILLLSCFVGNFGLFEENECLAIYKTFQQFVDLACKLDADMIRLWPAWQDSATAGEQVRERAARWCAKCCDYAAQFQKKVALEMHHGTLLDTLESCCDMLKRVDRENAGLILDPVNLYQVPVEDVKPYIYQLRDKIYVVHVKDIIRLPSGDNPYAFAYAFYAEHIGRFTKVIPPDSSRNDYYAHRRINQGGVDWNGILAALRDIRYTGYLTVESVEEGNRYLPAGRALAFACHRDLKMLLTGESKEKSWNIVSPDVAGMHEVISPKNRDCAVSNIFRLNLTAGQRYTLESGDREMNVLLADGTAAASFAGRDYEMKKLDSFYLPGGETAEIAASADSVFYIAAAVCEGYGKPLFRKLDLSLPIGGIHQIHGDGAMRREVFFTLDPASPASRLICGITWSQAGGWTSWPPHQHEADLEEVYCYLDKTRGLHIGYTEPGDFDHANYYPVRAGSMELAPAGYHPTVSMPGARNVYFWVLTALRHESRRYDLAVSDPAM